MAKGKTEKQKPVYIVLKDDTRKLLRMLGGQLQYSTGESVSDNDTLYHIFVQHYPDLIAELEEVKKREQQPL